MNSVKNIIPAPETDDLTPVSTVMRNMRDVLVPKYGARETMAMSRIIFEHLKGWDPVDLLINENKPLSAFIVRQIRDVVARLMNDEPIQYIVGSAYFYGMNLKVGRGVLVPRPETEELVDMIVTAHKGSDLRVLDVGAGSGCIAIALSRNLPFSQVTALDISDVAVKYIRENAEVLHARINVVEADIFSYQPPAESLDIIVSNPPYIDESEKRDMDKNVLDYEPASALFVPDSDPLVFYRRIAEIGRDALVDNGSVYFEINPAHASDMVAMMEALGYVNVSVHLDIHGKKRFLSAALRTRS